MSQNSARLALLLSLAVIAIVGLNFFTLKNKEAEKKTQEVNRQFALYKDTNSGGKVLAGGGGALGGWLFQVKSSSNNSYIDDASVAVSTNGCTNGTFISQYHAYVVNCNYEDTSTIASVTVSKSGYQSKTGNVPYYAGSFYEFSLDPQTASAPPASPPASSSPPPSTSNTTKKSTSSPPAATNAETIKNVALPEAFKNTGTTDLSKIADPAKVEGLTIDTTSNTIKFVSAVDLSASDTKDKFKELDKYVKIDREGIISLDSSSLPALNKSATLTMKGLDFLETPRILVNGKEDKSVVTNVKYANGVLTFDVTHFSTFIAAPTIKITEPKNGFESKEANISLKGVVSNPTASVSALLNGKDVGTIKVATKSGEFTKEITLIEGINKIIVNANLSNGAVAAATVSATLVKAAKATTNLLVYLALGLLVLAAVGIGIYSFRAMRKTKGLSTAKTQTTPTSGQNPQTKV